MYWREGRREKESSHEEGNGKHTVKRSKIKTIEGKVDGSTAYRKKERK